MKKRNFAIISVLIVCLVVTSVVVFKMFGKKDELPKTSDTAELKTEYSHNLDEHTTDAEADSETKSEPEETKNSVSETDKETDKATEKETEKPKETERPKETEKPKETERPKETEKSKETEKREPCDDGHRLKTVKGYAATCTSTGLTDGEVCTVCGKTVVPQKTISKKDHVKVTSPAVSANCTQSGITKGVYCSVCNATLSGREYVPALNHNYSSWNTVKKASCTENGTKERSCSRCGNKETEIIYARGTHNYSGGKCVDCGSSMPGTDNLIFRLRDDGSGYICLGIDDYTPPSSIVIPAYYNGKPVVGLAGNGLSSSKITEVIIPNTVQYIDQYFFANTGIRSITIPDSVQRIYGRAFASCYSLETVYISGAWESRGKVKEFSDPYDAARYWRNGELTWRTRQ